MKDNFGRKLYSLREYYKIMYLAFFSMPDFSSIKKNKFLNDHFIERIMLAVTEVNGCAVCSYAHTKMALEAGMTNEEIQNMLAGVSDNVPEEEMSAVMFAQHYADSRGYPSNESWERIVEIYGLPKSKGILASIRIIMFGNASGIPLSSFFNRFKGKADERSSLLYEIGMIIVTIIYIPIALIHAFLAKLFRIPIITFKTV
ncbi:MAG: carboxymuconolactone decarboxylase family protein [Gudongella sp.]|nr:carboxymuconolactone decarboxylase family protein [Gudongella sp.]